MKILVKFTCLLVTLLIFSTQGLGQEEKKDDATTLNPNYVLVHLTFGTQFPYADIKSRYGRNNEVALGFDYLTAKNWIFGIQAGYMFGTIVKEDVLATLRSVDGNIVGNNRAIADIRLTERGFSLYALTGKLFPLGNKKRAGIRTTLGIGMLQHKIRIQQDPMSLVPQASGPYAKGYDRLSNGLALTQFLGYQKVSRNKTINFLIGVEFTQAFTKNRRNWNFDTNMKDDNNYFDVLIGGKLGWTLPFEVGARAGEEIWY